MVNFSRLSCPYLRAIFGRHHPLRHSTKEVSRIRISGKLRQKAATDLLQFVAFSHCAFVAICCLHLKVFHEDKPYSSSKRGFCVREGVAVWTRNIRATGRHDGRGFVQSATALSPKTVHVRVPTVSASSPRPCPAHARIRVRNQSMSVTVATPRMSTSSPCPRIIRVQSASAPGSPPAPRESPFDCVARCASSR